VLNDPLFWILVLAGLLLGLYAQGRIKFNFAKYSQVGTQGWGRGRAPVVGFAGT
jgi:Zn-dependent membrane protease YugP